MSLSLVQCRPIGNISDITECLNQPPEWTTRVVPLKKRSGSVLKNTLDDCHSSAQNPRPRIDSRTVPKTLVCHDYKGGYLSDSYVPLEGFEHTTRETDGYTFYNWAQIDYFVYFSHHFITIPPLAWINAGHKHGVKILGTVITENKEGYEICNSNIFYSSENMREFAHQLVEIQKMFGFDGWLLNIENPVDNPNILVDFVKLLTNLSHSQDGESVIIWYDSVTKEGRLKWQDQLNDLNKCFFDVCDGIFLNYGWDEKKLTDTVYHAGNRFFDVFVGVDVFGRNMYGGGGFNTYKAAKLIRRFNLSLAFFAPGWTHETLEPSPQNAFSSFLNRDDALWVSLWPYLYTHPIKDFFQTDFHVGLDSEFYNLFMQQQQTSRILLPGNVKIIPDYSTIPSLNVCRCLRRGFVNGKNSCLITTKIRDNVHNVFTCDIKLNGTIGFYFVTKNDNPADSVTLELSLMTCNASRSFRTIKLLDEQKPLPMDLPSLLEVNPLSDEVVSYHPILNSVATEHTVKSMSNLRDSDGVVLRIYSFSTVECDLLEIGAILKNGTSLHLLKAGIIQLP